MVRRKSNGNRGKPRSRHKTIYALGQDRVREIDAMLVKGTPTREIATIIQEEWGEHTTIKHDTLHKQLNRYKKDQLTGTMLTTVTEHTEEGKKVTREFGVGKYAAKIDAHDALTEVVIMQQARLNKLYEREKTMPTLMDQTRKEIETTLKSLDQLAHLQFELGLIQRVPRHVKGELTMLNDQAMEQDAEVKQRMDVADQRLGLTHRVFDLLDRYKTDDIAEAEIVDDSNTGRET